MQKKTGRIIVIAERDFPPRFTRGDVLEAWCLGIAHWSDDAKAVAEADSYERIDGVRVEYRGCDTSYIDRLRETIEYEQAARHLGH